MAVAEGDRGRDRPVLPGWRARGALKRAYREVLVHGRGDVRIVYLKGDEPLIARRLTLRKGHFMPPGLLTSQFQTLEPPGDDEGVVTVSIDASVEAIVDDILGQLPPAPATCASPTGHPA
jgi:gluconokinase